MITARAGATRYPLDNIYYLIRISYVLLTQNSSFYVKFSPISLNLKQTVLCVNKSNRRKL